MSLPPTPGPPFDPPGPPSGGPPGNPDPHGNPTPFADEPITFAAPAQAQGQYIHGQPVTAWPPHGGLVPTHGAPIPITDPPSGAPQP